ncbi:MAG: phosphatidylinositol-specific phospholipase C [Kofleriaceae bacterium]
MARLAISICVAAGCASDPDPAWMAKLPDATNLAAMSIPGTHDSAARMEPIPGVAKTQDLDFQEQLDGGVRFFDLRLRNFQDQFWLYHGGIDQSQTLDDTLATLYGFLDAHPTETIIASVKEEEAAYEATLSFEQLFTQYTDMHPEKWSFGTTVPALGDVRGKIVLLRRFDSTTIAGIDGHPAIWTDNATFDIAGDAALHVEDEYVVTDNSLKWTAITRAFGQATADSDPATLYLTFTSGYQTVMGLPNIESVSDVIDPMIDSYLATAQGRQGIVIMDFVTAARAAAVIAAN